MKILVLGASGSLGSYVINELLKDKDTQIIAHSRRALNFKHDRVKTHVGDALNLADLKGVLSGIDAVYAGLAGNLEGLADVIIKAMSQTNVKRLVWISSYGIYGEANQVLPKSYISSAKAVESSGLDYTIIRPQWFSSVDEIDYEITHRHEPFKNPNAQISRKSIAHLVARCFYENFGVRDSLGINKKGSY
ncbi:NAD(P)H-binding protein [Campylobacter mucosalis]|uniref:NAD(P)H-binding protein n=1 Tax=Campylobacter mucosalis TaxID=202 RepID=UPI0014700858